MEYRFSAPITPQMKKGPNPTRGPGQFIGEETLQCRRRESAAADATP